MKGFLMLPLLLCALGGMVFYLAHRLYRGLTSFFPSVRLWAVLIAVGALVLLLVLSFARALLPFPEALKRVLGVAGGYGMGVALYLLLFTVAADLLLLAPRLCRLAFTTHHLSNGIVLLCVLSLTAATCIYGFVHVRQIEHVSYEIELTGKQDISDLNVVMISDLHLGAIGSEGRLQAVVAEINAAQPDVVCIAGDFFDTDFTAIQDPDAALEMLRKIRSTYGVYACLGNHDGGKTLSQMTDFFKQANIHLLNDSYTVIDGRLVLIGRLDASAIGGYSDQSRKPLAEFFVQEDPTMPVIVLDHNPIHIDEYGTEADLILCGHTHKGQVFPGNLITGFLYTVDHGYYQKDAQGPQAIVSSGVGAWGMPMRVGTNCEVVTVRFACKS